MIECKNCGSYLHFDITTQQLKCDYCGSSENVSKFDTVRSASDSEAYVADEINVYSFECPQCGGTIYGDRQDMTGFCSYCGTPVELNGRLTTIERPSAVIPFQKTKEDCKNIFKKMTRQNPFLPSGYSDIKHIDSFRGIYMPYFLYHVNYEGAFNTTAKDTSVRRGDYIYTDIYDVEGNLEGEYAGFEHDSSSTFDDGISEAIGPFSTKEKVTFRAGYLAGFYADASDERKEKYRENASKTAGKMVHKLINDRIHKERRSINLSVAENVYLNDDIRQVTAEKAMYPVWFMSYRNGNRVAYAAINGQTGKITADMPIDFKKFLLFVLLTAIPIFFFLNTLTFFTPNTMLYIYGISGIFTTYILHAQMKKIMRHDNIVMPNTKRAQGYAGQGVGQSTNQNMSQGATQSTNQNMSQGAGQDTNQNTRQKKRRKQKTSSDDPTIGFDFLGLVILIIAQYIEDIAPITLPAFVVIVIFIYAKSIMKMKKILYESDVRVMGIFASFFCLGAAFIGMPVMYLKPVSDLWYYGGCLLFLVSIFLQILMFVKNHNYLATRRPVQFNKKGGDDRA